MTLANRLLALISAIGLDIKALQQAGGGSSAPAGNPKEVQYNNAGAAGGAANVEIDGNDLTLLNNPAPTTPGVGAVKLFAKTMANARMMPAAVGPSGMDYALQPSVWRQKISHWNAPGNVNTVPAVYGFGAMTVAGTATARVVATTNLLTRVRRLAYVSAATAAAACSVRSANMFTTGNGAGLGGAFMSWRFAVSDAAAVAGARMFVGVDTAASTNVEMSTRTNCFGIAQLSTDSTQLYLVYGGSAAQAAVPLGTNFPPMQGVGAANGVFYDFSIFTPPNSNGVMMWQLERVNTAFSIGGTVTPTTPGVQTPANTTLLACSIYRTNNATLLAVAVDVSGIYAETDY